MPAWFYVVAVAAVLFVAWVAFARRWVHALFYSWTRARHLADLTQAEVIPGAEYIPYAPVSGSPPWPLDWREQTRVELAPETLDLLAAPPMHAGRLLGLPVECHCSEGGPCVCGCHDPGPGGDARLSTTPPPGPDQAAAGASQTDHTAATGTLLPPIRLADTRKAIKLQPHSDPDLPTFTAPTRLADTGDLAAAHEAHPAPDWLPPREGGPWRPPEGFPVGQVVTVEPGPDWLAAQMADLFAWVRAMVPQVTGWSVGA